MNRLLLCAAVLSASLLSSGCWYEYDRPGPNGEKGVWACRPSQFDANEKDCQFFAISQ